MSAGGIDGQFVDAELGALPAEQQSVDVSLDAELDDAGQSVAGTVLLEAS